MLSIHRFRNFVLLGGMFLLGTSFTLMIKFHAKNAPPVVESIYGLAIESSTLQVFSNAYEEEEQDTNETNADTTLDTTSSSSTMTKANSDPVADVERNKENRISVKETAVVISTHLISSHPSLDQLLTVLNSTKKYFIGLPVQAPLFITVDGILQTGQHNSRSSVDGTDANNRDKYDLYLKALFKYFAGQDHVKILVAEKNLGLTGNLRRVMDNLDKETKYMYVLQHDLPFVKEINHTAIQMTANSYPDIRIIRFQHKFNFRRRNSRVGTCETHEKDIVANGISLTKFARWSDQNHFASVDHYRNDILPYVTREFPEMNMMNIVALNCSYFGTHYYMSGFGGPYYKHRDATGRYGEELAKRVRSGEVKISNLKPSDLKDMQRKGVNVYELQEQAKKYNAHVV